ncbi:MAG: hypothetical protein WC737_05570 [Parcubacteria group bacterium]|jgi:hypothetical protein
MTQNTDMQTKLLQINNDVQSIVKQGAKIKIEKAEDMAPASEILKQIVARKKRIEELRVFFTKPLNDHIKDINNSFKASLKPLEELEMAIKKTMVTFREIERKAEEEKQRIEFEAEQKRQEEEAKELKGNAKKEALNEIQNQEFIPEVKQESKVESASGQTRFRTVTKFEVTDEALVPREYLMVDERLVRKAVTGGAREIPGVRIYDEELPSVY